MHKEKWEKHTQRRREKESAAQAPGSVFLPGTKWANALAEHTVNGAPRVTGSLKVRPRSESGLSVVLPACSQGSICSFKYLSQQLNSEGFFHFCVSLFPRLSSLSQSCSPLLEQKRFCLDTRTRRLPPLWVTPTPGPRARSRCHPHSSALSFPTSCSLLVNLITESYYGNYWPLWMS